ncbi:hypothetical protein BGZ83_005951 [Gryganskiella cystojenkinii]|nr:hypothetical protein BGZ83_005951 [Gryganskiella cystojenkinii]
MTFQSRILILVLGLVLACTGAMAGQGSRDNSCSFGYNNTYYIMGGTVELYMDTSTFFNFTNFLSTPLPLTLGDTFTWTALPDPPQWTAMPSVDSTPQFHCAVNRDGKVFLFGNAVGFAIYDIHTRSWSTTAPTFKAPIAMSNLLNQQGLNAAVHPDGYTISILTSSPQAYYMELDSRTMTLQGVAVPGFTQNVHGFCMDVVATNPPTPVACAGSTSAVYSGACWQFGLGSSASFPFTSLPSGSQDGCSLLAYNSEFMIIPGYLQGYHTSPPSATAINPDTTIYNFAAPKGWSTISNAQQPKQLPLRVYMAATVMPGTDTAILFGGYQPGLNLVYGDMYLVDMKNGNWANTINAAANPFPSPSSTASPSTASPSTVPTAPTTGGDGGKEGGSNTGAIAGGAVGGVAVLGIIAGALVYRKRQSQYSSTAYRPETIDIITQQDRARYGFVPEDGSIALEPTDSKPEFVPGSKSSDCPRRKSIGAPYCETTRTSGTLINAVDLGYRFDSCSFGYNNVYYILGGSFQSSTNFISAPLVDSGSMNFIWTSLPDPPQWLTMTQVGGWPEFDCAVNRDGIVFLFGNNVGFATYSIPKGAWNTTQPKFSSSVNMSNLYNQQGVGAAVHPDGYTISILTTSPSPTYMELDSRAMTISGSPATGVTANLHGFCMGVVPTSPPIPVACAGSAMGTYIGTCSQFSLKEAPSLIEGGLKVTQDGCSLMTYKDGFVFFPGYLSTYHDTLTKNPPSPVYNATNPDMSHYNMTTKAWTTISNLQGQNYIPLLDYASATVMPGTGIGILSGGLNPATNIPYNGTQAYDLSTNSWVISLPPALNPLPFPDTTPTPSPTSSTSTPKSSLAGIIGGAVGGLVVLSATIAGFFLYRRRHRRLPYERPKMFGPDHMEMDDSNLLIHNGTALEMDSRSRLESYSRDPSESRNGRGGFADSGYRTNGHLPSESVNLRGGYVPPQSDDGRLSELGRTKTTTSSEEYLKRIGRNPQGVDPEAMALRQNPHAILDREFA